MKTGMARRAVPIAAALLSLAGHAAAMQDPPRLPVNVDSQQAVSACVTAADRNRPLTDLNLAQRRRIVACVFVNTARQINSQLPTQVDDITRLDRISVSGAVLTYHYTVARQLAELPANVRELAEQSTRAKACAEANMRQTLQMGGAYAYRWVDSEGRQIHRFRIDAC
jgi:hypothetical protein